MEEIAKGFDRGVDFIDMKNKLIKELDEVYDKLQSTEDKYEIRTNLNKAVYIMIALLQLRNGSRICEACIAFRKYSMSNKVDDKVAVKIAKSEGMKYNNKTKTKTLQKARYRKMMFPTDWIDYEIFEFVISYKPLALTVAESLLRQRVRDYLFKNHECNTHSLRYAFINYMLHEQNKPMTDVAKFVGHSSVNQLVTYTQNKNTDKIFDLDI